MNTASNIVQFDTATTTISPDTVIDWSGTNTTTAVQNVCGNCGTYYIGYHTCPVNYWYPSYPVTKRDEVSELKAWLEGFMTGRKMTERNLKKIQDKLQEFCE